MGVGKAHSVNTVQCRKKKGRHVTVRLTGKNYLTLCEVKVFGFSCAGSRITLISQGKKATQSSEGWGGKPSRAIDGNTDQKYGKKSCTHTQKQKGWWKVDLGSKFKIDHVVVWNRADCC